MGLKEMAEHPVGSFFNAALSVSLFAIIGVLTRLWIKQLFLKIGVTVDGTALFPDLEANALGCFIMGYLTESGNILKRLHKHLHTGVSTGFLGSLTTFASWNLSVTQLIVRGEVGSALIALVLGTQVALISWVIGKQLAVWFSLRDGEAKTEMEEVEQLLSHHVLLVAFIANIVLIGLLTAGAVIDQDEVRIDIWIASLLAPIGAIGRWQLAKLNGKHGWFFYGTFTANMTAILVDSTVESVLLRVKIATEGKIDDLLESIVSGIAGALSTVSTWINETHSLDKPDGLMNSTDEEETLRSKNLVYLRGVRRQYVYIFASLLGAQVLLIVIYGTVYWTAPSSA